MQNTNYDAILRMILKYTNQTVTVKSLGSSMGSSYGSTPVDPGTGGGGSTSTHVDSDQWYDYKLLYNDDEDLIGFTSNNGTWNWIFVKDSFSDLYRINVVTPSATFHIGLIWENFDFRISDPETEDKGLLTDVVLIDDTTIVVTPPVVVTLPESKSATHTRDITYMWYKTIRNTNVYGNLVDTDNARAILGETYYTYIVTYEGYTLPVSLTEADIVVGGPGAIGGIPASDIGSAKWLWGIDATATALAVQNWADVLDNSQFVSGNSTVNGSLYYSGKTISEVGWNTSDTYSYNDGQYSGVLPETSLTESLIGWVTQLVYNALANGDYCGKVKVTEVFTGTVHLIV